MNTAPLPAEPAQDHGPENTVRKHGKILARLCPVLNVVSMLDLSFNLLIFFILTASFAPNEGALSTRLPGIIPPVDTAEVPPQPIRIVLSGSGLSGCTILIEGMASPQDFRELTTVLARLQLDPDHGRNGAFKPDNPVIIKPDGTVPWQHVISAFNAAIAARYQDVTFAPAGAANS